MMGSARAFPSLGGGAAGPFALRFCAIVMPILAVRREPGTESEHG